MRQLIEANIDAEELASFQEHEELFSGIAKGNNSVRKTFPLSYDENSGLDVEYWSKRLYHHKQEDDATKEYVNPYSDLGNTSTTANKSEDNILETMTNWISENPGKAILAALLIGGGSYFLIKHFKNRNSEQKDESTSVRRKRKRKGQTIEDNEETSNSPITAKEIAIGVAAAGAGALIGTAMKDYSAIAAVPVAAIGIVKESIPLIAAAVGLVLSGSIRKVLKRFFGDDGSGKNEREIKGDGYIKTMLGFIKPSEKSFSTS